jgi:hypothetical protein
VAAEGAVVSCLLGPVHLCVLARRMMNSIMALAAGGVWFSTREHRHPAIQNCSPWSQKNGVGRPARRRGEGEHDGGWRLRVAAVANCEAADRFVNSASPRAAAPRSLTDVLCPETLQPPNAPDGGGTTTGRRRTRPGEGLPPPVPTQTRGSLRVVIECAGTCITRRQPPQVPLQL